MPFVIARDRRLPAQARPALVVATAGKPAASKTRALATSQALGEDEELRGIVVEGREASGTLFLGRAQGHTSLFMEADDTTRDGGREIEGPIVPDVLD